MELLDFPSEMGPYRGEYLNRLKGRISYLAENENVVITSIGQPELVENTSDYFRLKTELKGTKKLLFNITFSYKEILTTTIRKAAENGLNR